MSHTALIRLGLADTGDGIYSDLRREHRGGDGGELYGNMQFAPDREPPLLVDHVKDAKPIGRVKSLLRTWETPFGGTQWLTAFCEITDPPCWLEKGTPASISYAALHRQELEGWMITRKGLVTEVSVLSPGKRPAEPLAQVVSFSPVERPAAAVPSTSDRVAAADSSPLEWPDEAARRWAAAAPLGTIRRVGVGQVLGVR